MRRVVAALAALALGIGAVAGVALWRYGSERPPQLPEISAYSDGHLTRVGPYRFCRVLNLNDCETSSAQGELPVNEDHPVQLSVPGAIGEAPWRLLRVYENPVDTTVTNFRAGTRLAETIPTVDPQRGRLTGIVVQLLTLVLDPAGELADVPHAEWSVRMLWP